MRLAPRLNSDGVSRRIWFLWAPAFALILLFGGTLLMYFRVSRMLSADPEGAPWSWEGFGPGAVFAGFVLLFILYTIWKQRELDGMRRALVAEEGEATAARARFSELVDLFQLASRLNVTISVERMLEIIVRRSVGCLKAQQASIMLLTEDGETLETRASYGVEGEYAWSGRQKLGDGIAGWVAKHKKPLLLNRGDDHPVLKLNTKPHRNISSAVSVPILCDGRCIGVLNVNRINHPEPLTGEQLDIVRLFAEHVGGVIERANRIEELGEKTKTLEAANAELVEFGRMKDAFLSTASHELKTPLTSVIGYAELLSDHFQNLPVRDQQEFLQRLRSEAGRLMELIEDIMDLSRLETGKTKLQIQEASLNDVVRSAVETLRGAARRELPAIVEEYDAGLEALRLDAGKVRQVAVNLLSNAVRFTPDGGAITVRTAREGSGVVLTVTDQGPGVAPEDRERIFTLFGQGAKKSDKDASGLGIGLHVVKRIVELHGGRVGVESEPGQGSTFWVWFPEGGIAEGESRSAA